MKGAPLTQGTTRYNYNERPKPKCGTLVVKLAEENQPAHHRYCKRWDCKTCRKFKINKYQGVVLDSELGQVTYISERPPIKTKKDVNALSNFIKNHVKGAYFIIKSDLRVLLITKNNHRAAIRRKTKTVIDVLIPDVLNESWSKMHHRRFTHSIKSTSPLVLLIGDEETDKPFGKENEMKDKRDYAQVYLKHGEYDKANKIIKEFRALKTDDDRAVWLIEHEDEVVLFERGEEIIEAYRARSAAPQAYNHTSTALCCAAL